MSKRWPTKDEHWGLMSPREVARITGLSQYWIIQQVQAGALSGAQVDGRWLIERESVEAFVKARES